MRFQAKFGVLGLLILVVFAGARLRSMGESDDTELRAAVRSELMSRLGGRIGRDLRDIDEISVEAGREILARSNPLGIDIRSLKVSAPLLSWSSSEDVVVRVEFSLPESEPEVEYWRFRHSLAAGWRYVRPTSVVSYWLNLL